MTRVSWPRHDQGPIAFLLFSTVSIHVIHPRTADRGPVGAGQLGLGLRFVLGFAGQRGLRERGPARVCLNI